MPAIRLLWIRARWMPWHQKKREHWPGTCLPRWKTSGSGCTQTICFFVPRSVLSSFPVSAGGPRVKCWRPVCLCDIGSRECDQVGCGALCGAGMGGQAPLPAGGKWERRGLLCPACLCPGLHQVSSANAHTYSGDVSRGGWSPYPSHTGSRFVVVCEGVSGLLCLEKEASYEHRRQLEPLTHPLPCQDRPSQIHPHSARQSPGCQGAKIKPLCYFYWWALLLFSLPMLVTLVVFCSSLTFFFSPLLILSVPQGSETAWLYSSSEGRKQLAASANFRRLVIVTMHRNQQYTDMQAVQSELSPMVMDLAPPGMPANQQVTRIIIPF